MVILMNFPDTFNVVHDTEPCFSVSVLLRTCSIRRPHIASPNQAAFPLCGLWKLADEDR